MIKVLAADVAALREGTMPPAACGHTLRPHVPHGSRMTTNRPPPCAHRAAFSKIVVVVVVVVVPTRDLLTGPVQMA